MYEAQQKQHTLGRGALVGAATASEMSEPEVARASRALAGIVTSVEEQLQMLSDRLSPVMSSSPVNDSQAGGQFGYSAPLALSINEQACRLARIDSRLRDLIGSLAV